MKKASTQMPLTTAQATSSSNECDGGSSSNITKKNQHFYNTCKSFKNSECVKLYHKTKLFSKVIIVMVICHIHIK